MIKNKRVENSNLFFFNIKEDFNEDSCARIDAVLVKKRDSKSHLRKSVVANQLGPSMTKVLDERLSNMEQSLGDNVPISKGK